MIKFLISIFFIVSFGYSQIGIQVAKTNTEISPTVYIMDDITEYYSLQLNIFCVGIVPKDQYNQNKPSGSMYSVYSFASLIGVATLIADGKEWPGLCAFLPESSFVRSAVVTIGKGLIYSIFLTNSQHHLNLYGYDSCSASKIASSLFINLQTDYFDRRDISWLRFSPSGGLEILFRITNRPISGKFNGYGIGLQFGLQKSWDLLTHYSVSNAYTGFVCAKLNFPI